MNDQNWLDEQKRVNLVMEIIHKRMNALQQYASEKRADIVEIRKHFWDDVKVNFDDRGETAETYRSMKQQADVLSEKERSYRHNQKQLEALKRLEQSPYFGRIDFVEDGERVTETVYLGVASLLDDDEFTFLINDWRAPISSLYYDFPPGPAQYETPGGIIAGKLELKRQYIIRHGRIESMFDTGLTIGDELLQEVLGKQSDAQMKSIVATIQQEQNRIIRNERSRLLVVQGPAGSGKTSAALQRAAYLLYRFRETLSADQIVLFSPNPMFNSYVSTVLPELGEENMQQTTFQEYVEYRLGDTFRLEDPLTQMEYVLTQMNEAGYDARIEGIRYKASLDFMRRLEQYLAVLEQGGFLFRHVEFRGEELFSAELIREKFYSLDRSMSIPGRLKWLRDWLLKELHDKARLERRKPWVEEEIELLDNEAYIQAFRRLKRKKGYTEETFDDFEREKEILAKYVVSEQFKPLRSFIKRLQFVDMPGIYRQIFTGSADTAIFAPDAAKCPNWTEICRQTAEKLDRSVLAYEDAVPYLFLKDNIEGFQVNNTIKHVFIDEAQDYSLFQFAYIRHMFPRSKMTVLGDINQAIYAHVADGAGVQTLYSLFGDEEAQTYTLSRTYRSTREIVEFTKTLIAGSEEIEPFNRRGLKPTVTRVSGEHELVETIANRVESLQAAGHRTIGIICKTALECEQAYAPLRDQIELRLIGQEAASFEQGVLLIPSYLAKGVEFDAVILFNGSQDQYGRESERKLFYTACTRAMHELHICYIGEMNRFMAAAPPDTYTFIAQNE